MHGQHCPAPPPHFAPHIVAHAGRRPRCRTACSTRRRSWHRPCSAHTRPRAPPVGIWQPPLLVERSVLSTPVVVVGDLREGPRNTNTRRIGAHNVGCALGRHRALGTGACVRCDGCCASGGEGQRRGVGGDGAGVITAQLIGEGGEAEHDSPIWPLFHRDALEPPEAAPVDQNKYFHGTPNVPRPAPSW